jgi:hypothetical protein
MNPLLAKLTAKPVTTAVTLSFQVPLELSDKLNAVSERIKQPKYHVLKILMEQSIDDLNKALDEELPDLTPTPEYDETGIADV